MLSHSGLLRRERSAPSASRPRVRCRKKSPANISWCGRRSEATGSSQPISGTTASRSRIRNVRVCRRRGDRMMRRREFIMLLGGAAAWPLAARAQQAAMPVLGVLRINPKDMNEIFAEPFRRYMRALGWDEERNIRFQFVWAGGRNDRIPALAEELVAPEG